MNEPRARAPAVSVILPTFNRLHFLGPTIDSLFAQTFTDWELIIADDGSDAATRSRLYELSDPPRISVLSLTHVGRPGVVRNAALRKACGQLVAFLDSDDLWLPLKLERQIASLRRHPQCSWGYTAFELMDAAGRTQPPRPDHMGPVISGWIAESMLNGETVIALPSVIVRREALDHVGGGFDEELTMCEDDELWLRLALHSQIDGIDEPLTLIRRHAEHGGNDETAWRDRRRVFEKALRLSGARRLDGMLRRLRAEMSAGLARSQAVGARRLRAMGTLAASAPYSWRYRRWWQATGYILANLLGALVLRGAVCRHGRDGLRRGHR